MSIAIATRFFLQRKYVNIFAVYILKYSLDRTLVFNDLEFVSFLINLYLLIVS